MCDSWLHFHSGLRAVSIAQWQFKSWSCIFLPSPLVLVCFQIWCFIPGSVQWSNPLFRPWYEIAISLALYSYNWDHLPCLPWCNSSFGGNNKPLRRLFWPHLCLHMSLLSMGLHECGLQRHAQLHSCADIVTADVRFDILVYIVQKWERAHTDRFIAVYFIVSHR